MISGAQEAWVAAGRQGESGAVAPGSPIPGGSGHSLSKLEGSKHS